MQFTLFDPRRREQSFVPQNTVVGDPADAKMEVTNIFSPGHTVDVAMEPK